MPDAANPYAAGMVELPPSWLRALAEVQIQQIEKLPQPAAWWFRCRLIRAQAKWLSRI
jgi:hypothetical protein